ncbi:hypothetical protein [Xylophilus ampelinus]|uniref:Uncharacterized protein n=1 Tax=Xylophilus ampelinus TaxID=54067 RepID=A0A318SF76_9BURK|nr:hypothetical protein [Xylophilus ampelinus]MCS4511132.1 hypothetical protein [Xylophilus ampelinus]PYE75878.1 hypothetical protein DFQ15_1183 [Xylophilus ampelinus]
MSGKKLTLEEAKRLYPTEYAAAMAQGAHNERERWKGIEAVADDLGPGYEAMVQACKANGNCTGATLAQLALKQRQGQLAAQAAYLQRGGVPQP